jgi:hypothetical protein
MKLMLMSLVLVVVSGCSMAASSGDYVTLTGTPKGIQSFSDLTNGMIRTGKESAERPSEYFAHRGTQEKEHTSRCAQAVGFWQKVSQCH